jgi:MFS family permease
MDLRGATRRVGRADALLLSAALWFVAKFLRFAFPPLFPTFRDSFGVSNTVLGAAFTALMVVYAAMQFPAGALADRVGAARVVAGGALLTAAAALGVGLSGTFSAVVVGMVLIGLGTGVHKTVSMDLLASIHPERTGRALGFLDTVGTLGGAAASAAVVAALAAPRYGWGAVFVAAGVAGTVLAVCLLRRVPKRETAPDAGPLPIRDYAALFADRRLVAFVASTLLFSATYNGAVAFLPTYLATAGGLTEAGAGALYSTLFLASLVQPVTGEAADRFGAFPTLLATGSVLALGVAALVALGPGGALPLGVAVVVFGLGSHGYRPVRGAYLMAELPPRVAGGGLGAVRTLLTGAGALAPAAVGVLADAFGFRVAFGALAASAAAAAVLTAGLYATREW